MAFAQKKDTPLLQFGQNVHVCFLAHPVDLAGCPVSALTLDAGNQDFSAKLGAMKQGGTTATADKKASRLALIALLRQIAAWLEGKAQGNLDLITLAGFEATSHGHVAQTQLSTPTIKAILNVITAQLKLRGSSVRNAHSYEVQYRIGTGAWQEGGVFSNPRIMVVIDLVPGTLYEFRVRAVGGSTGYSNWSDTMSHMCT